MKIAFIGDSYMAYDQYHQQESSWTWLLSEHFPQHEYYNYSLGGRGYDYYRLALLDAKINDVDIVITNSTFNHRVMIQAGDGGGIFIEEPTSNPYYKLKYHHYHFWKSGQMEAKSDGLKLTHIPSSIVDQIGTALEVKQTSEDYLTYNQLWFDNMDKLYNFKHIIKLSLLLNPNNVKDEDMNDASWKMQSEYGIVQYLSEQLYLHNSKKPNDLNQVMQDNGISLMEAVGIIKNKLLLKHNLIVSMDDDHWSAKGNKWAFDNYILPKVVDILS
jgi:hypothetical protein